MLNKAKRKTDKRIMNLLFPLKLSLVAYAARVCHCNFSINNNEHMRATHATALIQNARVCG